jgi:hypothetical protein
MSPRFVELTRGTSGLLLAYLSVQIPMPAGLIRARARLTHLVLSPLPAVVLTLIMGILMELLVPLYRILGVRPESGPDFIVAFALFAAAGYAAGRQLVRRHSTNPSEIERLPDLEGFLKLASIPDWSRVRLTPVSYPTVPRGRPGGAPGGPAVRAGGPMQRNSHP